MQRSAGKTFRRGGWLAVAAGVFLLPSHFAWAQPQVSQPVVAKQAILDEFGNPLVGTSAETYKFGHPAMQGDMLHVYHATDNNIYPPNASGQPDSRNVLLMEMRVGRGTSPALANAGLFGAMVSPRPGGNSRIFVRAFNAPTVEEASFYGDSTTFLVRSFRNDVFYVTIDKTDEALDSGDSDGDGLNNAWEKSFGTDPNKQDSDGDGYTDAEEAQLLKTDPLDAEAKLVLVDVQPAGMADAWLTWDSEEGVSYRLEYTADGLNADPVFELVAVVPAEEGDTTSLLVPDGLADERGCYRVRVVAP